jgi:hypothetical protein
MGSQPTPGDAELPQRLEYASPQRTRRLPRPGVSVVLSAMAVSALSVVAVVVSLSGLLSPSPPPEFVPSLFFAVVGGGVLALEALSLFGRARLAAGVMVLVLLLAHAPMLGNLFAATDLGQQVVLFAATVALTTVTGAHFLWWWKLS